MSRALHAAAATPQHEGVIERMVRHDRAIVILGLAVMTVLAWASLVRMSGGMHAEMAMPLMRVWSWGDLVVLFLMWAVMMVAMMLPTAAPMVMAFASVQRRRREGRRPYVHTGVFVAGYLVVWIAYAAAAALAQWGLHQTALLSPMMVSTSQALGAALLIAAGIYQFTPLKHVCLAKCRSPLGFIAAEWREGGTGAFQMGIRHGMYCVGCCWILMALLFVAGVMNLGWVAVIAGFVLLEKIAPGGAWVSRVAGVLLAAAGFWMGAAALG